MEQEEIRKRIDELSTKEIEWVFERFWHLLTAETHRQRLLEQVKKDSAIVEEALKVLRSEAVE